MRKDVIIIRMGLNLASHETIMAVKPIPPAKFLEIVWLVPETRRKPASPQMPPESTIVRIMTFLTLIPIYLAVFSLSPTTEIS